MQEAMTPGVVLKRMEGFRVAYVPHNGPHAEIGIAFQRLVYLLRERHLRPDGPMMALYYDDPTCEDAGSKSEACVPVMGDLRPDAELRTREIPPTSVASLIHDGPPSRYPDSCRAIESWIKGNGYLRAGPVRLVYAHDLTEIPPGILYVEIQVPVRRKGHRS